MSIVKTQYCCDLATQLNNICKDCGLTYNGTTMRPSMHGPDDRNEVYTVHLSNGVKFTNSCEITARLRAMDYLKGYLAGMESIDEE